MNSDLKLFLFACGVLYALVVLYFLSKQKISEKNVIVWGFGVILILVMSAKPEWFDWAANALGVSYPPSLLFFVSTMILLVVVLYQSMQISVLQNKVKQIAQHIAIQPYLTEAPNVEKRVDVPSFTETLAETAASAEETFSESESLPETENLSKLETNSKMDATDPYWEPPTRE